MQRRSLGWFEERLGWAGFREKFLDKAFPMHPSFFLGEIALFSFVILVITGIYLLFSYEPSAQIITVGGRSFPAAYHSVIQIDKQPFGLIVRQVHHWAAHLMIAVVILHLLRVFFTGAFKKPREINWVIGILLLLTTVVASFTGYLLPYDAFSVTASGIGYQIAASIPWIGVALAKFVFAGQFPAIGTIPRFFGYHVVIIPLLLIGLIGLHLLVMIKQKHTEPSSSRGRVAPGQLLGIPLWPQQASLMVILFLLMTGGLLLIASIFPVHPIELYGPPGPQTPTVKPDWYFLWVFGLLKLIPGWLEIHLGGTVLDPEVIGGILLPGLLILLIFLVPFLNQTRERQNYLEPVTRHPLRTSIGIGVLALLLTLSVATYQEVLAISLAIFRLAAVLLPLLVGIATYLAIHLFRGWRSKTIKRAREPLSSDR